METMEKELMEAIVNRNYNKIIHILKEHRELINSGKEVTPLLQSIINRDIRLVQTFIRWGADVNKSAKNGVTPFLHAAFLGETQIMDLLRRSGADIYYVNKRKYSEKNAMMYALESGKYKTIEYLVPYGLNLSLKDEFGNTFIDYIRDMDIIDIKFLCRYIKNYSEEDQKKIKGVRLEKLFQ